MLVYDGIVGRIGAMSVSLSLVLAACAGSANEPSEPGGVTPLRDAPDISYECKVDHGFPYPAGVPFVGVHGNRENNDYIPCETASNFIQAWHSLKHHAIGQPNTFSPDGKVTYVTSNNPDIDGCTVHAIDASTGAVLWCRSYLEAVWSTVEVDEDGNLYFTALAQLISLTAQGEERWRLAGLESAPGTSVQGLFGVHFTPQGHIATVTNDGEVLLVRRSDGEVLDRLSIPDTYGFVAPESISAAIDVAALLPAYLTEDLHTIAADTGSDSIFGSFLGAGGNFSDNTVAISPHGDIYVIGGGQSKETGALVQIRVEGSAEAPKLVPGWHLNTVGGSAASPSVSPDGALVHVSDGAGPKALLNPGSVTATTRIVDIEACDTNTDADSDPLVCAEVYGVPFKLGAAVGSMPLLNDGVHYTYETTLTSLADAEKIDLSAFDGDTLLWERDLPDGMHWTSVITVTENHLIGTGTRFDMSDESILTVAMPATANSELLVIDRITGEVVFRHPVTDDSASTVTVGPDGALYVTMLAIFHCMARDTRPVAGMIRFSPHP